MDLTMRNTADHWLAPGDTGQTLQFEDREVTVNEVNAVAHEPLILTYGLRLIPSVVIVTVEYQD